MSAWLSTAVQVIGLIDTTVLAVCLIHGLLGGFPAFYYGYVLLFMMGPLALVWSTKVTTDREMKMKALCWICGNLGLIGVLGLMAHLEPRLGLPLLLIRILFMAIVCAFLCSLGSTGEPYSRTSTVLSTMNAEGGRRMLSANNRQEWLTSMASDSEDVGVRVREGRCDVGENHEQPLLPVTELSEASTDVRRSMSVDSEPPPSYMELNLVLDGETGRRSETPPPPYNKACE